MKKQTIKISLPIKVGRGKPIPPVKIHGGKKGKKGYGKKDRRKNKVYP